MFEIGAGKLFAKYSLVLWIVFGGNVNALLALQRARKNKLVFTVVDYLIAAIVAMFAGTMFGVLSLAIGLPEKYLFSAVGLGTYLSVEGLNRVTSVVLTSVLSKYQPNSDDSTKT